MKYDYRLPDALKILSLLDSDTRLFRVVFSSMARRAAFWWQLDVVFLAKLFLTFPTGLPLLNQLVHPRNLFYLLHNFFGRKSNLSLKIIQYGLVGGIRISQDGLVGGIPMISEAVSWSEGYNLIP